MTERYGNRLAWLAVATDPRMRMAEIGGERFAANAASNGVNDQRGVADSTRGGSGRQSP
ncbi:hypothetical protein [Rhodanobacter soli]|nr:hypothetical protein [Rhodanobacter denitrificans]